MRINLLLSLLSIWIVAGCQTEQKKSNILFIFADDQTFNSINALGNTEVKTPSLDNLVNEGMTFTHTYNMGAWHGAVCVASRTMLNTGSFVWRAYKNEKRLKELAANNLFWSQMMKESGYDTYFSGKWHVGIDPTEIFDNVRHIRPGMPKDTPEGYNRPVEGQEDVWSPYDEKFGGFWEGGKHWSEVLADDAEDFLSMAKQSEKPFFMYLAFNAPHDPRQAPKEFVDMYPSNQIAIPASYQPEYPYMGLIGYDQNLRDERLAPYPRTEYAVQVNRQEYYAIITHMDQQIGRILNALEKTGMKDNTYIFFTADHGLACGNHGLLGKQNMYDHSLRPPMVVVGPDVLKNSKNGADIYLQDVMATSLEIAGNSKPASVEFNSFLSALTNQSVSHEPYNSIYGCYTDAQRMIRKDHMKLIVYPKAEKVLLFDLKNDPEELQDISDGEGYQEIIEGLFKDLQRLQLSMDDTTDIFELSHYH